MDVCPGHILESTKGIEMELGIYIDGIMRKDNVQEPYSFSVYLLSNLPLTIYFFIMDACPSHNFTKKDWFVDR